MWPNSTRLGANVKQRLAILVSILAILATLAAIARVTAPHRESPAAEPENSVLTGAQAEHLDTKLEARWGRLGLAGLLPEERDWIWLWWLHVEVDNNSFDQFFGNETGDHAPEMLDALQRVGAVRARAILVSAMAVYDPAGGYTTDREERRERAARVRENLDRDDLWDASDREFRTCDEPFQSWAIARVRAAYVRAGI